MLIALGPGANDQQLVAVQAPRSTSLLQLWMSLGTLHHAGSAPEKPGFQGMVFGVTQRFAMAFRESRKR